MSTTQDEDNSIVVTLPNGNQLICGPGDRWAHGGYLRVLDPWGHEIGYWDHKEWEQEGEGECVVGAAFRCAAFGLLNQAV